MDSLNNPYQMILASQSPRRRELISHLGISFKVIPSKISENGTQVCPIELACYHAEKKGDDVFKHIEAEGIITNPFVIASDTVVSFKEHILGKPKNRRHVSYFVNHLSENYK